MAKLEILTYPNPILREISEPVTQFDGQLKKLIADMLETMYAANGIGLAAPQVGELKQLVVIDTRPKAENSERRIKGDDMTELESVIEQPLVLINPKIKKGYGSTTFDEGCLSVPTFYDEVKRFEKIDIEFQDVNGKKIEFTVDGLLAICIQHEMDHLNGTLFIDHLSFMKSNKIKNQIKKNGYKPVNKDNEDSEVKDRKKDKV